MQFFFCLKMFAAPPTYLRIQTLTTLYLWQAGRPVRISDCCQPIAEVSFHPLRFKNLKGTEKTKHNFFSLCC